MAEDQDQQTESTESRYWLTNDLLTGGLFLLLVGLNVAYFYAHQEIPFWLQGVDATSITIAIVWAFGGKAASKAAEFFTPPANE